MKLGEKCLIDITHVAL